MRGGEAGRLLTGRFHLQGGPQRPIIRRSYRSVAYNGALAGAETVET